MIFTRDDLRPIPMYPTYPPYHVGDYIEDYFYKWFIREKPNVSRDYIAMSWTSLYCDNKDPGIQQFLDSLDQSKKYFTVCQHDDAPRHRLPKDTIIFSLARARYNPLNPTPIPIPAVCSPVPKQENVKKDIFASFVGSITHPIRMKLYEICKNETNYYFSGQMWNPQITNQKMNEFFEITNRTKYALCPRGYGNTSFRMYEAMQLNCVPVYISDDFYLPWSDEIDWNSFAIIVKSEHMQDIPKMLNDIPESKYNEMLQNIKKVYSEYFTLEGTCKNITKRIK